MQLLIATAVLAVTPVQEELLEIEKNIAALRIVQTMEAIPFDTLVEQEDHYLARAAVLMEKERVTYDQIVNYNRTDSEKLIAFLTPNRMLILLSILLLLICGPILIWLYALDMAFKIPSVVYESLLWVVCCSAILSGNTFLGPLGFLFLLIPICWTHDKRFKTLDDFSEVLLMGFIVWLFGAWVYDNPLLAVCAFVAMVFALKETNFVKTFSVLLDRKDDDLTGIAISGFILLFTYALLIILNAPEWLWGFNSIRFSWAFVAIGTTATSSIIISFRYYGSNYEWSDKAFSFTTNFTDNYKRINCVVAVVIFSFLYIGIMYPDKYLTPVVGTWATMFVCLKYLEANKRSKQEWALAGIGFAAILFFVAEIITHHPQYFFFGYNEGGLLTTSHIFS